jgi:trehalose 6-phosphate phosphatase
MKYLFSKNNLIHLQSLSFAKTVYAFDFDGTLAKIVQLPQDAYMTKLTSQLIRQLNEVAPIAIISGRSVNDLKKRIPFAPKYLIGNHGLEGILKNQGTLEKAKLVSDQWRNDLLMAPFESGIEIEDKTYSLAIHYRRARNKTDAKNRIFNSIKALSPEPRVISGKSVFNLVPIGAPHKGTAILELMKKTKTKKVFYIGDDDTDEDVFSFPYENSALMSVRVGFKKTSNASYFLERQSEINRLLKLLITYHQDLK